MDRHDDVCTVGTQPSGSGLVGETVGSDGPEGGAVDRFARERLLSRSFRHYGQVFDALTL
eukprot:scaffold1375_cov255-Pinguiococcus_pyrenoidosus.AAC.9